MNSVNINTNPLTNDHSIDNSNEQNLIFKPKINNKRQNRKKHNIKYEKENNTDKISNTIVTNNTSITITTNYTNNSKESKNNKENEIINEKIKEYNEKPENLVIYVKKIYHKLSLLEVILILLFTII